MSCCFKIRIAEKIVEVTALYESTKKYCCHYLSTEEPDFSLAISSADIAREREKSARENVLEGLPPRTYSDAYLETIALQRKIAEAFFDYDILLFHGSAVAVDGQAYLFTARSGTGKSTHTCLWRQLFGERASMVNDDKPFLELSQECVIVHGSPWNGKHDLGNNISVPLKAICVLERGIQNDITPISSHQVLPMLVQQSNRPQDSVKMKKYLELLDKLSKNTKFYHMKCNIDVEAAEIAHEVMSK